MDEFEKWLEDELGNNVYENIYRTHLLRVRAKYRAHKAKAVVAKATAEGSLVELCKELLEMAENPDAVIQRATENSDAVYKSECFDFEKARQTLSRYRPAPVEAKATAEGSLVEYPCPTCGAERFKTERRMNGDSWCRYGHKHPTKDFVRPAPTAVEELVRAIRQWSADYLPDTEEHGSFSLDRIIRRYEDKI